MTITLIKFKYNERHKTIIIKLMIYDCKIEFPVNSNLEIDFSWQSLPSRFFSRDERGEIETFVRQVLFSKLLEVV